MKDRVVVLQRLRPRAAAARQQNARRRHRRRARLQRPDSPREPDQRLVRGGLGQGASGRHSRCSRTTARAQGAARAEDSPSKRRWPPMAARSRRARKWPPPWSASSGMRRPAISSSRSATDIRPSNRMPPADRSGIRTPRWSAGRHRALCRRVRESAARHQVGGLDRARLPRRQVQLSGRFSADGRSGRMARFGRYSVERRVNIAAAILIDGIDRRVLAVHRGGRADAGLRRAQYSQLRPWQPVRRRRLCGGERGRLVLRRQFRRRPFLGYFVMLGAALAGRGRDGAAARARRAAALLSAATRWCSCS